jgi:hypothetical protein
MMELCIIGLSFGLACVDRGCVLSLSVVGLVAGGVVSFATDWGICGLRLARVRDWRWGEVTVVGEWVWFLPVGDMFLSTMIWRVGT